MSQVNLQIPLNSSLKQKASLVAKEEGFSSLQELVRIFLAKYADKKIRINFTENEIKEEKKYKKYIKRLEKVAEEAENDIKNGNYITTNSREELMKLMMVADQNILYTPKSSD